ncbi:MAG: hypothetical protein F4053_00775 [Proteobacteria bacterium]|nr:hypothetical protein [Pseudomonadota bacterium]
MADNRRVNIKAILADPNLRRKLMVSTIQATQAREGIDTTEEQADRAYYVVSEGERVTFFALRSFRGTKKGETDRRNEMFVRAVRGETKHTRFNVARRDFRIVESSILAFKNLSWLTPVFSRFAPLVPQHGLTRSGLNTTEINRFVRLRWEVSGKTSNCHWVTFAKGGDFCRFYTDWDLVFDWTDDGAEYKQVVASKYGSASRFVKSENEYFKEGITWVQTTNLGINARVLPDSGIFGVASPTFFPSNSQKKFYLLGIMNSVIFDALARCVATRNWGATAIGSLPTPSIVEDQYASIAQRAEEIHSAKAIWDRCNEISLDFGRPWILHDAWVETDASIPRRLSDLGAREQKEERRIVRFYAALNDDVYKLYSIPDSDRAAIEKTLGDRPSEVLWPQMAGKTDVQKRMEHVWRLLSYAVKRVVEMDEDGIVPFAPLSGETSLLDRVHDEIATLFPKQDVNQVEVEIANELKRKIKGYKRASSIGEWLDNIYFEYHASLYKKRPIIWHISSSQGSSSSAFSALCHCHKFDANRMAKLRAGYLRDAIEVFQREAALADRGGRAEDRIEWQAKLEETQTLDRKLQAVQEGHHEGVDGGDIDYRILTPWKSPEDRPKGWAPDIDDGVKVNIEPLQKAGVLRVVKVV